MSPLDRALNNDFLMVSKSLIPYLPPDTQRSLAVFVKTFELMYTIDLFSKEDFVRSMSRSHDTGWEKAFLGDVRKNITDERGYFIDAILKLTEAKELLAPRHSDSQNTEIDLTSAPSPIPFENETPHQTTPKNSGPNPNEVIDKLSGLLEPNQVQLLKVLSSFMK